MSDSGETPAGRTCARPGCANPVQDQGGQGSARLYCGNSCRSLNYQRRQKLALDDPQLQIRLATERALRHLETTRVNDALPLVRADVRRNFEKVRKVLHEIESRLPDVDDEDADG